MKKPFDLIYEPRHSFVSRRTHFGTEMFFLLHPVQRFRFDGNFIAMACGKKIVFSTSLLIFLDAFAREHVEKVYLVLIFALHLGNH